MTDFSECELIESKMKYYTYFDFCANKERIRDLYIKMTENGKQFYKYYVYANTHMTLMFKDKIWDYLNGFDLNGFELMKMRRLYKKQ